MPSFFDSIKAFGKRAVEEAYERILSPFPADLLLGQDNIVSGDIENCLAQGKVPIYDSFGNFVACHNKRDIVPTTPKVRKIPKVSNPPFTIYNLPPPPVGLPVTPIPRNPPRRLPTTTPLPTGGGLSIGIPRQAITVKTSVNNGKYGCLLHEPITKTPIKINVCNNANYSSQFKERQKLAATKFLFYIFDKLDIPIPPLTQQSQSQTPQEISQQQDEFNALKKLNLRDSGLTIISRKPFRTTSNTSGGSRTGVIFGSQGISDYINDYINRSSSDLLNISGLVHLDYELVPCPIYEPEEQNPGKIFKPYNIEAQVSSGLTEKIYQILGGDNWFVNSTTPAIDTDGETLIKNIISRVYPQPPTNQTNNQSTPPDPRAPEVLTPFHITNIVELIGLLNANQFYRAGLHEFPAIVPSNLVTSIDESLTAEQRRTAERNAVVKISSLSQFLNWFFERFDEVVGEFEIPIEITDTDATTPENQSRKIKLPNIAESIAELFLLAFQSTVDIQTLVSITTRTMIETGQDKQQNYITYRLLHSLVDWAGYKIKDYPYKLPLLFTPGKEKLDELLTKTEVNITVAEFESKHSLEADLMRFRRLASIGEAGGFKKINPFGDIKAQVLKSMFDNLKLMKDSKNFDQGAWDKFIADVQEGFARQPGIDSPEKPYGRNFAERPKIRDLTDITPPQS